MEWVLDHVLFVYFAVGSLYAWINYRTASEVEEEMANMVQMDEDARKWLLNELQQMIERKREYFEQGISIDPVDEAIQGIMEAIERQEVEQETTMLIQHNLRKVDSKLMLYSMFVVQALFWMPLLCYGMYCKIYIIYLRGCNTMLRWKLRRRQAYLHLQKKRENLYRI